MTQVRSLLCLFLLLFVSLVWAEDEEVEGEDAAPSAPAPIYIPLKPQFVVNYGGAGKLRYLKTGVTVRLSSSDAAAAIRHHMPFVRNNLVMLFAKQTDETLESQDGREALREQALKEVRELLVKEDGIDPQNVVEVLFVSLTWH